MRDILGTNAPATTGRSEATQLQYVISKLISNFIADDPGNFNTAVGILANVKSELYRKQITPHLIQAEFDLENGVV